MTWTWQFEDAAGKPVDLPSETFTTQSDAESWIGSEWRVLAGKGVARVILINDDHEEYTMSLEPGS